MAQFNSFNKIRQMRSVNTSTNDINLCIKIFCIIVIGTTRIILFKAIDDLAWWIRHTSLEYWGGVNEKVHLLICWTRKRSAISISIEFLFFNFFNFIIQIISSFPFAWLLVYPEISIAPSHLTNSQRETIYIYITPDEIELHQEYDCIPRE